MSNANTSQPKLSCNNQYRYFYVNIIIVNDIILTLDTIEELDDVSETEEIVPEIVATPDFPRVGYDTIGVLAVLLYKIKIKYCYVQHNNCYRTKYYAT